MAATKNLDKSYVILQYQSGISGMKIAEELGCSFVAIYNLLKRAGIQTRSLSEATTGITRNVPRRHTLNESAFDTITEESAYWVGFLMADGCVLKNPNCKQKSVALSLSVKDICHVEAYKRFLGSSQKITVSQPPPPIAGRINGGPTCRLTIHSDRIVNALERFGIVPRKSLTAKVIGLEDDPNFWRGVIDGDGSVIMENVKGEANTRPRLSLIGSYAMIEQFRQFIAKHAPGFSGKHQCRGKAATISTAGEFAVDIIRLLYGNCTVALPRKLERAKRAMEWKRLTINWDRFDKAGLLALYHEHGTWKNVAPIVGMNYNSLIDAVRRHRIA